MSPALSAAQRAAGASLAPARALPADVGDRTPCLSCGQPLIDVAGSRLHPTCTVDPDATASELFTILADAITNQPRSLQTRIGPSELGTPCDRRLGYKLAGVPEVNNRHGVGWKAFIGTALHEQFAQIFARLEIDRYETEASTTPRWYVEDRVTAGQISDTDIDGNCDLFDAWTGTVWDWKFTTKNKIRETYRPHGPGEQYAVQAQNYGRGWASRGMDVRTVGIVFMTRDGEFSDRYVWHTPFTPEVSAAAFARANSIDLALRSLGPDFTLQTLPTADAYCSFCPWFTKGSTTIATACPGHPTTRANTPPVTGGPAFGAVTTPRKDTAA